MAPSHDIENPAADPLLPAQDESDNCLTCQATPGGREAAQEVVNGQDIYSQPGVYRGIPDKSDDEPSDTKGVMASVATLLFSLPALGMRACIHSSFWCLYLRFGVPVSANISLALFDTDQPAVSYLQLVADVGRFCWLDSLESQLQQGRSPFPTALALVSHWLL